MIGFFKRLLARRDAIANDVVRLIEEEQDKYCAMSAEELLALSDDELLAVVWMRTERVVAGFDSERRALDNMNDAQKNFYIIQYYVLQVNDGGLCQYFANAGRDTAFFLSDALTAVGAEEHRALFEAFLHDNKVATAALLSFAVDNSRDFKKMEKSYPFEEFNTSFYALAPLTESVAAYVRENIGAF